MVKADRKNIEAALETQGKKTINMQELKVLFDTHSDEDLHAIIDYAVAEGLLLPVKSAGVNGNRVYPVYLKYRIMTLADHSEALHRISMLHPLLLKAGYLQKHPEIYEKYQDRLDKLSTFLFKKDSHAPVSRKEKSFEIFDEEKVLDDRTFCNVLSHLNLSPDALGYYDTPEYCFNDFIRVRKSSMTLLICENKDIWFNIRRRMYEDGAAAIFGISIDGVVYGCGNKVSETGALAAYTQFLEAESVSYLYWGDIDRAGFNIFLSLKKNNPEVTINLFTEAYCEMIRLSRNRSIPDSADHRGICNDYSEILTHFPEEFANAISEYLCDNKRIPQEIVNYERLLECMR